MPAAVRLRQQAVLPPRVRLVSRARRRAACQGPALRRPEVRPADVLPVPGRAELQALAQGSLPREGSRGAPLERPRAAAEPGVQTRRLAAWGAPELLPVAAVASVVPVRPPGAASDVRGLLRAAGVASVAQARLRVARAVSDVPEPPRAAVSAVPERQAAAVRGAVLRPGVPADAVRLRVARAAPDGRERPERAAASAFHPGRVLPSAAPVRRRAVRFARAMLKRRTASPSAQSWQAARDEAVSCYWNPRRKVWAGRKQRESRTIRR